jgi:hypothetical protein
MPQTFVCLKDGTDLTQAVLDDINGTGISVLKVQSGSADWQALVTCPTDNCLNWFSGAVANTAGGDATIPGMVPGVIATYLSDAAKQLGPAQSLATSGDAAKFVLDRISLVALVLGGFGIFTDLGGGFDRHPTLFATVTVASALALALAVVALFPRVKKNLDYGNLVAVKHAFESVIKWRVRFAQLATLALLIGIGAALVAFFKAKDDATPVATLSASYDGSGDQPLLSYTADLKSLPEGATATVRLIGLKSRTDTAGKELASTSGTRDRNGDAKIDSKFVSKGYGAYRIVAAAVWGKKDKNGQQSHLNEDLTVVTPPFAAKPAAPKKTAAKKTAAKKTATKKTKMKASGGN